MIYKPKAKLALASSFEGVINNGATECGLVSLNAYQKMYPGSFFGKIIDPAELSQYVDSAVFKAFLALRPKVKTAEDYHTVLRLIETYPSQVETLLNDPTNVSNYDFFIEKFEEVKAATQEERIVFGTKKDRVPDEQQCEFYKERARLKKADERAWFGTQRPYGTTITEFRKLVDTQVWKGHGEDQVLVAGFIPWFVTTKDEASTFDLCSLYSDMGLLDETDISEHTSGRCIISRKRIIGAETEKDKLKQVQLVSEREGLPPEQIFAMNDRYDAEDQIRLSDNGFHRQLIITGGYVFPHEIQKARNDSLVTVVEREKMAEEIARYAQRHGF